MHRNAYERSSILTDNEEISNLVLILQLKANDSQQLSFISINIHEIW